MAMKGILMSLAVTAALAASASALAKKPAPLDKIQERTADALGLEVEDFTVSNVEREGDATRYVATANGKGGATWKCYITDAADGYLGIVTRKRVYSDAVCNQKGKKASNALLRAAGKE